MRGEWIQAVQGRSRGDFSGSPVRYVESECWQTEMVSHCFRNLADRANMSPEAL